MSRREDLVHDRALERHGFDDAANGLTIIRRRRRLTPRLVDPGECLQDLAAMPVGDGGSIERGDDVLGGQPARFKTGSDLEKGVESGRHRPECALHLRSRRLDLSSDPPFF
jgi:hypothetical protein